MKSADRASPKDARLKAALAPLSPRRVSLQHGFVMGLLWSAAVTLMIYGLLTVRPAVLLPMAAVVYLWHAKVTLPGMSLTDSRLYRRLRPLQAQPMSARDIAVYVITIVVSLGVGTVWVFIALAALGSYRGVDESALPLGITVSAWFLGAVVVPAVAAAGLWMLRRRKAAAEETARRRIEQLELVNSTGRCQCWDTSVLAGPVVEVYLSHHLRPLTLPSSLEAVIETHRFFNLSTASCAQTGAAWLKLTVAAEGDSYLLRSPVGEGAEDAISGEERDATDLPSGLYL